MSFVTFRPEGVLQSRISFSPARLEDGENPRPSTKQLMTNKNKIKKTLRDMTFYIPSYLLLTYFFPFSNDLKFVRCITIYRVAQKNWNGILPTICGCNNWYQCMWYQDHQFWFSSLFPRAHFVRQCQDPKFCLSSLNLE